MTSSRRWIHCDTPIPDTPTSVRYYNTVSGVTGELAKPSAEARGRLNAVSDCTYDAHHSNGELPLSGTSLSNSRIVGQTAMNHGRRSFLTDKWSAWSNGDSTSAGQTPTQRTLDSRPRIGCNYVTSHYDGSNRKTSETRNIGAAIHSTNASSPYRINDGVHVSKNAAAVREFGADRRRSCQWQANADQNVNHVGRLQRVGSVSASRQRFEPIIGVHQSRQLLQKKDSWESHPANDNTYRSATLPASASARNTTKLNNSPNIYNRNYSPLHGSLNRISSTRNCFRGPAVISRTPSVVNYGGSDALTWNVDTPNATLRVNSSRTKRQRLQLVAPSSQRSDDNYCHTLNELPPTGARSRQTATALGSPRTRVHTWPRPGKRRYSGDERFRLVPIGPGIQVLEPESIVRKLICEKLPADGR